MNIPASARKPPIIGLNPMEIAKKVPNIPTFLPRLVGDEMSRINVIKVCQTKTVKVPCKNLKSNKVGKLGEAINKPENKAEPELPAKMNNFLFPILSEINHVKLPTIR